MRPPSAHATWNSPLNDTAILAQFNALDVVGPQVCPNVSKSREGVPVTIALLSEKKIPTGLRVVIIRFV